MSEPRKVTPAEAAGEWNAAALHILEGAACRYGAVIPYGDLAEAILASTGTSSSVPMRHWIGGVLADVVTSCEERGTPALTALVVRKDDGMVGEGYDVVLASAGVAVDDEMKRERHAAAARLECYRHWGADVPDGATPQLTAVLERKVRRLKRTPEREILLCPSCFIQLPATGVCQSCDQ